MFITIANACKNDIIDSSLTSDNLNVIYTSNRFESFIDSPRLIYNGSKLIYGINDDTYENVIDVSDYEEFIRIFESFKNSIYWKPNITPTKKYLIFMDRIRNVTELFVYLKSNFIINVIVINFKSNFEYFAYKPNTFCNDQLIYSKELFNCTNARMSFVKLKHVLYNCNVNIIVNIIMNESYVGFNIDNPGILIRPLYYLEDLYNWNLTFTVLPKLKQLSLIQNERVNISNADFFVPLMYRSHGNKTFESSKIVLYDYYLWIFPLPQKKSNVKILTTIYNYKIWILIAFTFLIATIINGIINILNVKKFNLLNSILDAFRLSLGTGIKEQTTFNYYRIYIISFVIYSFHINYMYQAKLSATLTSANYEDRIRNVEQLLDSKLRLVIPGMTRNMLLKSPNILSRVVAEISEEFANEASKTDALYMLDRNIALLSRRMKSTPKEYEEIDYFVDTISPILEFNYGFPNGSYYLPLVNNILIIIEEQGFMSKWINDLMRRYIMPILNDDVILTFDHLMGAFLILSVGLFAGLVTFILEILHYKYFGKI